VKAYVLKRANGHCEACKKAAPFVRKDGSPYLEPHHIKRVADGGPDHPRSVGAVCPTCHRFIHHGEGGSKLNVELEQCVMEIEQRGIWKVLPNSAITGFRADVCFIALFGTCRSYDVRSLRGKADLAAPRAEVRLRPDLLRNSRPATFTV